MCFALGPDQATVTETVAALHAVGTALQSFLRLLIIQRFADVVAKQGVTWVPKPDAIIQTDIIPGDHLQYVGA